MAQSQAKADEISDACFFVIVKNGPVNRTSELGTLWDIFNVDGSSAGFCKPNLSPQNNWKLH